jgi:hypothetical protein
LSRLKAEIAADILAHLPGQATPPTPQSAPVPVVASPPETPLPAGMKFCRHGHEPYPATKAECPGCVRDRKRRQRDRTAQTRRG